MSDWIYEPAGSEFRPSGHARGPWDPQAQHGGPAAALLARAIERVDPGTDMLVARLTFEFLAPVPLAPLQTAARIVRPGRRFQLVEGELTAAGDVVVRARAVRLLQAPVELPDGALADAAAPCAGPQDCAPSQFPGAGGGEAFSRTGMEIRFAPGSDFGVGPAQAWFRLAQPLVAGEAPSGLQRAVAAADFGNGVSRVLDFDRHLFINTDLTVHLHRAVTGEWVLLDARTVIDPDGVGVASSRLYDAAGGVGVAAQTLVVRER